MPPNVDQQDPEHPVNCPESRTLRAASQRVQLLPERPVERLQALLGRLSPALMGAGLAVLILFVGATVPSQGVPPFIYFRF